MSDIVNPMIVILNSFQDPLTSSSHKMLKQVQHDEVYI